MRAVRTGDRQLRHGDWQAPLVRRLREGAGRGGEQDEANEEESASVRTLKPVTVLQPRRGAEI